MMTVEEVLENCRRVLPVSKYIDVPLGRRLRLWDSMRVAFGEEEALQRRKLLAFRVARRTLTLWNVPAEQITDQ